MSTRNKSAMRGKNLASRRNIILLAIIATAIIAAVYIIIRPAGDKPAGLDDKQQGKVVTTDRKSGAKTSAGGVAPVAGKAQTAARQPPTLIEDEEEEEADRNQNAWVRAAVVDLVGARNARMIYPENQPLEQLTAVLASVSEGRIVSRQVRFWRDAQNFGKNFPVRKSRGLVYMDKKGYRRFDRLVTILTDIDTQFLVSLFNRLEPTLQKSYRILGYKRGNVRTLLRTAIDNALAAPVIEQSIPLKQDSVHYKFADADLERRSPVQKQIIRTGATNTRKLQKWLKRMRNSI